MAARSPVSEADVAALRASIERLPALPVTGSDAERMWAAYRERFRHDVLARDPRRFLRWPVIQPMYKRDAPYIGGWLAHLKAHPGWRSRWQPAVRESAVGDPRPFFAYWPSSGNLLCQAYYVCRFEEVTGARLSDVDFILEFGGGYGALCRLLCALGFRGTYAIFDFPEFSALQRFYLRSHGLPVSEGGLATAERPPVDGVGPNVVTLSTPAEMDTLLERRSPGRAAFVALWSLSETSPAVRDAVALRLAAFDLFAFGYQGASFGEVDNPTWFGAMRARLADIDWHDMPIEPPVAAARHLFGSRRGSRPATVVDRALHR
jgi:hypothetical protein